MNTLMSRTTDDGELIVEIADYKGEVHDYVPRDISIDADADTDTFSCRLEKADSPNDPTTYKLSAEGQKWSCSCPDFIYRKRPAGEICKHIVECKKVRKLMLAVRNLTKGVSA